MYRLPMFFNNVYLFTAALIQSLGYSQTIQVNVKQGTLLGTVGETVFDGRPYYAFYGVPYAKAPTGKLRFKNPKPQKKWQRPYDARMEYHGTCAQTPLLHKNRIQGYENCLHMNIYTPHLPKHNAIDLKPVIVWVHGYAFMNSYSHIHGGDFLLDNDVLVITVSHRIGVFGFLKVNDTDVHANMGLKDIIMALKWIRKNIQQFSGDSDNITVMGSGSAATFLSILLTTKFRTMFSKMILQSGALFSPSLFHGDSKFERHRLKEALSKRGISDIMNATTSDLLAASQNIYTRKEVINFQRPIIPFSPSIEGQSNKSVLVKRPDDFYTIITKIQPKIPILIGFNTEESISEVIPFIHNPLLLKSFASPFKFMVPFSGGCYFNYTTKEYELIGNRIKWNYFRNGLTEKSVTDFLKYTSDLLKYPVYKFIQSHIKKKGSKVYMYKFHHNGIFSAVKATSMAGAHIIVRGSSNGDEVCYILKCEPLWENYVKIINDTNDRDRIFIKEITQLWANFAKFGDPTPPSYKGDVTWPQITIDHDNVLLISGAKRVITSKKERKMFQFWNKLYDDFYSPEHCSKRHDEL